MISTYGRTGFAFLVLSLLSFAAADALADTIYACARENDGRLRVVSGPGQCTKKEFDVSWDDGAGLNIGELEGRVTALEELLDRVNAPPSVEAGEDATILLSMTHSLTGSATDDGIYDPLVISWEKVSGPGSAHFSNPLSPLSDVSFDATGTYELQLSAYDGEISVSDSLVVVVFPENDPPVIEEIIVSHFYGTAGADNTINCSTDLDAVVPEDDGPLPLTFAWDVEYRGDPGSCGLGEPCLFLASAPIVNHPSSSQPTATHVQNFVIHENFWNDYHNCAPWGEAGETICVIRVHFTLHASDGWHTTSRTEDPHCLVQQP